MGGPLHFSFRDWHGDIFSIETHTATIFDWVQNPGLFEEDEKFLTRLKDYALRKRKVPLGSPLTYGIIAVDSIAKKMVSMQSYSNPGKISTSSVQFELTAYTQKGSYSFEEEFSELHRLQELIKRGWVEIQSSFRIESTTPIPKNFDVEKYLLSNKGFGYFIINPPGWTIHHWLNADFDAFEKVEDLFELPQESIDMWVEFLSHLIKEEKIS